MAVSKSSLGSTLPLDADAVSPDSLLAAIEVSMARLQTVASLTHRHPNWNTFEMRLLEQGMETLVVTRAEAL